MLVEINNESNDSGYQHPILHPARVHELIARVKTRSAGRLKVSTSFYGSAQPSDAVIRKSDFVLLHGNGETATGITSMVQTLRARDVYAAAPKPIVFNEDSSAIHNLDAAVGQHASWGYYDQGANDYANGFQSPPVRWTINTSAKTAFFNRVATLTDTAA